MFCFWVNCKECQHSYDICIGPLSYGDYPAYCDKCGKRKIMEAFDIDEENSRKCECGGSYGEENKPKCPQCHSEEYVKDFSKPQSLCD